MNSKNIHPTKSLEDSIISTLSQKILATTIANLHKNSTPSTSPDPIWGIMYFELSIRWMRYTEGFTKPGVYRPDVVAVLENCKNQRELQEEFFLKLMRTQRTRIYLALL